MCYMMMPSKYGKSKFKLCQVVNIYTFEHRNVRRVEVQMRPTQKAEPACSNSTRTLSRISSLSRACTLMEEI